MDSMEEPHTSPRSGAGAFSEGFLLGVATAGFQIEGGYNGIGQVANNWSAWEQVGRVEQSGDAVGFWDRPEEALDRAAGLGCNSFRLSVEWARVVPDASTVDHDALARYAAIVAGCLDRGLEPLVTLHHFTHPAWLGEEFWLRPDAPDRYRGWVELAVDALAPWVRRWVTINEINILVIGSWLLGKFPPGRILGFEDAAIALDNLLAAHVAGYEVVHRMVDDAVVTTNSSCLSIYEYDRVLTDLLFARSMGVDRGDIGDWLVERRRLHDSLIPVSGAGEQLLRRMSASGTRCGAAPGLSRRRRSRALEAVYESPWDRSLDVIGLDYYDPVVTRRLSVPGRRTAGGRNRRPTRELWDDVPGPDGLTQRLLAESSLAPGVPIWVLENGLCNRVRNGNSYARLDGWDRPRYLREHIAAVASAIDRGVPVQGYWHWSLVDNYEWGSFQPRFGLYGVDRQPGSGWSRWLDCDSMGDDAPGAYRSIIAGLRSGNRGVIDPV